MTLGIVKIAEWRRSKATNEFTAIVLIDSRNVFYGRQHYSGVAGTEYLKRVVIDYASGSVSEEIVASARDGTAMGGLKIISRDLVKRFGGYGEVYGNCHLKGVLYNLDTGEYVCICDGAENCNLTSNLAKIAYDPKTGYLICDGGCSGRWIWVIDPNDLSIKGRASESYIRGKDFTNIEIIPRDDEKVFVIASTNIGRTEKYLRIGVVDIDDIVENAPNKPNVDELGSWEELYKNTETYRSRCWIEASCNGYTIRLALYRDKAIIGIYSPIDGTLDEALTERPLSISPLFSGWYVVDPSNKKHRILNRNASETLYELEDQYLTDKVNSVLWFTLITNLGDGKEILTAIGIDGRVPWIQWDLENRRFRVIDFITGEEMSIDVIMVWSRLQFSPSVFTSLPYVANNRVEKKHVSGWTSIPNPPSRNVNVLYVIPDFIGISL